MITKPNTGWDCGLVIMIGWNMAQEQNVQNTLANGTVVHLKNKTKANTYLLIFLSPFLVLTLLMIGITVKSIVQNMDSFLWLASISSVVILWAMTLNRYVKYNEMAESETVNT